MTSIVKESGLRNHERSAVEPGECLCPACQMSPVSCLQVLPLDIAVLDRIVSMRKALSREMGSNGKAPRDRGDGGEDPIDLELAEAQAEASYLLLSHGNSTAALCSDNEYQRTGRWTDDEMAFTNFLVQAFDNGELPLESGLKLNEFLSDVLLCKSSRLTKKMKNARLSTRSYDLRYPVPSLDVQVFSSLEQKFLHSISSEPSRMEVQFNLAKYWRSQVSNLCLQVGGTLLDNSAYIASLEDIERRAIEAEENIRSARRKRVGLSIRRDTQQQGGGGGGGGGDHRHHHSIDSESFQSQNKKVKIECRSDFPNMDTATVVNDMDAQQQLPQQEPPEVISSNNNNSNSASSVPSDDFSKIFDDFPDEDRCGPTTLPKRLRNGHGPFLDEVLGYVENFEVPFQHVDVWVPSYTTGPTGEEVMRLFHAGHATQSRLDEESYARVTEFGMYSKRFSFSADEDLPGRVFASKKPHWVRQFHQADPRTYQRSEGAKLYGIKTAFGFPLESTVVDRIVVCVYSTSDIPENHFVVKKCQTELTKLCPKPKWKLVVEMGPGSVPVVPQPRRIPTNMPQCGGDISTVASSQTRQASAEKVSETEHRMASLLGEYMPKSDGTSENTTSLVSTLLVPHFMSLRLLLLTSNEQRTEDEKNMIDIIRKSFTSHSDDKNKSDHDLAFLILKEWQCIQSTMQYTARASIGKSLHKNQSQPTRSISAAYHSNSNTHSTRQPQKSSTIEMDDCTDFAPFGFETRVEELE